MSTCQCSMAISMLGDGCRYCQPQTYIEHLLETLEDARAVSEAKAQEPVWSASAEIAAFESFDYADRCFRLRREGQHYVYATTEKELELFSAGAKWGASLRPVSEAKAQSVVMPEGWIPLTIEHEPGYPEDVAFGPKRMMDRLKKWLDRYFEMRLNAAQAAPAADAGLVDPAAWLWVWLMTYCKSRGLAPATQGHLFESVSDMRAVLAASRAHGVPSAKS